MKDKILEIIQNSEEIYLTPDSIYQEMGLQITKSGEFLETLEKLVDEGVLIKSKKGKYAMISNTDFYSGIFHSSRAGYGFITPIKSSGTFAFDIENSKSGDKFTRRAVYELSSDLYVHRTNINSAMNGDTVMFELLKNSFQNKLEARVVKILKRANYTIIGEFYQGRKTANLFPDDKKITNTIYIDYHNTLNAKIGQKVVARVLEWPNANGNIKAEVIEVLGYPDDYGVDILSIIRKFKLPDRFPEKVSKRAKTLPKIVEEKDREDRRDCTKDLVITIDGADAKDLDDAISLKMLPSGNYKLDVHIADVTHYVIEDSEIDKEALKRGTSVYLINKVIPMLPVELSNGICSLNPDVERLCLTCSMEIDRTGKVVSSEVYKSVIKSKYRMTYKDVSDLLEKREDAKYEEYNELVPMLSMMEELCLILRNKRDQRGSIDFNFTESKIIVDEETGEVSAIEPVERRIANRIIEEFMLVSNETVAEYVFWMEYPFVYRVHQNPDDEKIMTFRRHLANLGHSLHMGNQALSPKAVQEVLKLIAGTKEEKTLNKLLLRSLKKAKYSSSCEGHFGLACKYYCHFTAPIRRYPDLQIHRILKEIIDSKLSHDRIAELKVRVSSIADLSSTAELNADEAERDAQDMKKAQYMANFIGEEFEGNISMIMPFGIFVELDNTVEGMVRATSLDDYFDYDEENMTMGCERTNTLYSLGDRLRVQLIGADEENREIDFLILEKIDESQIV